MLKSQDGGWCRWILRRGMSKINNKNRPAGANLWAANQVRRSVTLDPPRGMYVTGKKERANGRRGEMPVGCRARTGVEIRRNRDVLRADTKRTPHWDFVNKRWTRRCQRSVGNVRLCNSGVGSLLLKASIRKTKRNIREST